MDNLNHSSPSLSWRSRWCRAGEKLGTEAASDMRMSSLLVSAMVRGCLFVTTGDLAHLFPGCSLRDLLLEDEHGGLRHVCRSGFDVKEALFIQARDRERNVGASRWSMEKGQGKWKVIGWLGGTCVRGCLKCQERRACVSLLGFSPSFLLLSRPDNKKLFRAKF
jgi:hypothetical protein